MPNDFSKKKQMNNSLNYDYKHDEIIITEGPSIDVALPKVSKNSFSEKQKFSKSIIHNSSRNTKPNLLPKTNKKLSRTKSLMDFELV